MNEAEAWGQRLAQLNREIPDLFSAGRSVLYVGATPHRFQMGRELFEAGCKVTLLEAFKPYADYYEDHPWLSDVICADVRQISEVSDGRVWDLVVWWHGPEHIQEDQLPDTLSDLEAVAGEMIILGCPWGENIHGMVGGNPYSVHSNHLDCRDLDELGYHTRTLGERGNPETWCHILAWKRTHGNVNYHNVTVYTAIFGGYDDLRPVTWNDARFVCFTDEPIEVSGWEIRRVERQFYDLRLEARMYKALAHQWIRTEYSIWQDGNALLTASPSSFVSRIGKDDVCLFAHPVRQCVYDEAEAVVNLGKAPVELVGEQIDRYSRDGFPRGAGLIATGVVVRRNTPAVALLNDAWWSEITRYTNRDQLSFNYCAWKLGIAYAVIPGDLWENELVAWTRHNGSIS